MNLGIEYCNVIYHIPHTIQPQDKGGEITLQSLMERVEKIQYQAALAVTGAWQGTNRAKRYEKLGFYKFYSYIRWSMGKPRYI